MKSFTRILALAVVLYAGAWITPPKASAQETTVNFQLFYDQLSPYGTWVDYQNYGYVWIPDVDQGFSPYGTDGHWIFTDDGWTWVSDYSWGWAPFHYGRWAYDDFYGWLWVPHNEWGPAWVTWRRSEGYYGWAPMGPGISIDISFGRDYRVPNERWIFVSDRDFDRPDIDRHYVDRSRNVTIINNSTVINNTYSDRSRNARYVAGPAKDDVQKFTGKAIRPIVIRENDKPGQTLSNDQLQIYRPRVQTVENNNRKPVPSKLANLKEVKPVSERKPGIRRQNENQPADNRGQSSQPQIVKPPDTKERGQQPRVVNPTNENKSLGQPSQPKTVKPPENKRRGYQPGVVNPTNENKSIGQPSQPKTIKQSGNEGREQQPRVVRTPYKNKSIVQPQTAQPSDTKRRGPQSPTANPPNKNANIDQHSKPRNGLAPNNKRQSPKSATPSNNKGKVRDSQPQKSDKKKEDGSIPPQQQSESLHSMENGNNQFISII